MQKVLFLCGSKYTLFNCISLACSEKFKAYYCDLVIFCDNNMVGLADKVRKEKIFNNVFQVDFVNNYGYLKKTILFLFAKQILDPHKSLFDFKIKYDDYISQSIFYLSLAKRLFGCADAYLIEEGLSTYTSRVDSSDKRSFLYKLSKIVSLNRTNVEIKGLYVNNLSLVVNKDKEIKEIPSLSYEAEKTINNVFQYNSKETDRRKITFLGSPFYGIKALLKDPKKASSSFENRCDLIVYQLLTPYAQYVTYRKHPRENYSIENRIKGLYIDEDNSIWELIAKQEITEESVLISFFSTASFTPKILFDKEPYIMFLYTLLDEEMYNADYLVNQIKISYKNKSKVLLPKSIDEAVKMLNNIINK